MEERREDTSSSGYWYREPDQVSAVEILNLLRTYRRHETAMRTRVRGDMGMGERDIEALRHLLAARSRGASLRQKDLAVTLGITAASASALVDRLIRDGYAERVPHPQDLRSVAVVPTEHGDREVRATLARMHEQMLAAAERLTEEQRRVVAGFLREVTAAFG
ncbi:MarR family transcriptional regulator [Rothia kristinae]|uniref:MarR family transcriptional regulator n=1 Tax=Rothia kristinae TaxID=37923 RepID=A0A1S2N104_9MICC|nr:MarR family transcriptional regulator [Rothia kristinae]OIJ36377.1 MarR family transcriptional regulator [Rothia kristinae]